MRGGGGILAPQRASDSWAGIGETLRNGVLPLNQGRWRQSVGVFSTAGKGPQKKGHFASRRLLL